MSRYRYIKCHNPECRKRLFIAVDDWIIFGGKFHCNEKCVKKAQELNLPEIEDD